ncbi:putative Glycerophosphoryl diester phosphodiesterase [Candidatus Terasakiella magnetica]|uniref:Putative Glycerophosphoryl diester phosphodiesterase n=1 Tax=Candidatus Terasakiella magnetica TaxID=1867952 RepID=A0A1C3RKJ3_9PROT|nr:glycerophosphodiester phosphodiesterase family protein [Candidatus Terasakiella magnetica]SCA57741.1 putative Glycerophosphoryl diester phosphodiesterase [Candidatus Terasakiella magnetica]
MLMAPIIGHRGCAGHAPENTLAGIRDAERVGCRWVEADATLLADETVVLFHDDTLDRCTDKSGFIREIDWIEALKLDAGRWFGDGRFVGERIPLLSDGIDCCRALKLGFNIELKTHRGEGEHLGQAVAAQLSSTENILVSSYDQNALTSFRKTQNDCPLGIIYDDLPKDWIKLADDLKAASIHLWAKHLSKEAIDEVKATGRDVYVFTLNDRLEAKRLWAMGVDGVFSDLPDCVMLEA